MLPEMLEDMFTRYVCTEHVSFRFMYMLQDMLEERVRRNATQCNAMQRNAIMQFIAMQCNAINAINAIHCKYPEHFWYHRILG